MANGKRIREEDKQALLDLVREEIQAHREGRLERLSTYNELTSLVGSCKNTVIKYLLEISEEDRSYRATVLRSAAGKKRASDMTLEQQRAAGQKSIELYGNPFDRLTPTQRTANGKRRIELHGPPQLTLEQRRIIGKQAAQAVRKTRYFVNGNYFDSQSEAAAAALLEKYVPEFEVKEGESFQVSGGLRKTIDFFVDGAFLEWHPILMFAGRRGFGDMPSVEQYQKYKVIKSEIDPERAKVFERRYKRILAANYLAERQAAVDASDLYAGRKVVLVQTPEELYNFINQRVSGLPSRDEFVEEFNSIKKQVKKANDKVAA